MANELKINASVVAEIGNFKYLFAPGQMMVDLAAGGRGGHAQSIGTSEEVVDVGDVSTLGYCVLRNTDSTNYVTYGPDSGGSMVSLGRLNAGEFAILRLEPGITLRARANTAAVKLDVTVLEN